VIQFGIYIYIVPPPPVIPPLPAHLCYTMAEILSGSQNVHIGGGTITAAQTVRDMTCLDLGLGY